MTIRKIVYTRPDGGISVVTPVRNTHPVLETLTDAEIEQRAFAKLPPDAINPVFVDPTMIPTDRSFRNAWKHDLTVDIPKAQEITRQRLRKEREKLFVENDMKLRDAMLSGIKKDIDDAVAERDRLRDVTRLADNVTDLEQLKVLKAAKV